MKRWIMLLAAAGVSTLLAGCATEFSKSEYAVGITSEKPGQSFQIYNRHGDFIHAGKTPRIVVLPAQSDFFAREKFIIKYGDKEHHLEAGYSPLYWGNVIMPFGFGVDGITGAMWALPKRITLGQPQPAGEINL